MVKNQFFIIIIPSRLLVLLKTKNKFHFTVTERQRKPQNSDCLQFKSYN